MQTVLLLVCTIPFWTSNVIRMISWVPLLGRNGLVNQALLGGHLVDRTLEWLLYSNFSVVLAFVHLYMMWRSRAPLERAFSVPLRCICAVGGKGFFSLARENRESSIFYDALSVTEKHRKSPFVDAETLIATPDGDRLFVDVRLGDPEAELEKFRDGHIFGAVHAQIRDVFAAQPMAHSGNLPLPYLEDLRFTLEAWGVDAQTEIVLYGPTLALAARGWWVLRWAGPERVIASQFAKSGVLPDSDVIVYYGGGVLSALTWITLAEAGVSVRLYVGS